MNGKTAKFIRQWARDNDADPEMVKTLWKNTPRNLRGQLSKRLKDELKTSEAK